MGWNKPKRELDVPSRHRRLGRLRRLAGELLPLRRQRLRSSMDGSMALVSEADRKAVAAVSTNVETWRAQAYQAYWRTQVR